MPVVLRVYEWGDVHGSDKDPSVVFGRITMNYPGVAGRFLCVILREESVVNLPKLKGLWASLPRRTTMYQPELDDEDDDD